MKEVYVTLRGRGEVYWMENFANTPDDWNNIDLDDFWTLEDKGWLDGDLHEIAFILDLEGVYVGEEEWSEDEDITKEKGKYIKRIDILKKDCNLTPPFYVRCINGETEIDNTFCIELEDDEVFDPKQLQLVKSDYEVEFLPYGIVSNHIVYKGKEIVMYDEDGYRDKGWNRPFVCTEYYK